MKTWHALATFAAPAIVGVTAALADTLPPLQQCLRLPSPTLTIPAATQIQDWCDPGNRNLLQVDVFIKLANGTKGSYFFSTLNIDCIRNTASIPSSVKTRFC